MSGSESRFGPDWIDAELVLERSLASGDGLDILQEVLAAAAPRWISKLRIWRSSRDQRPIDAGKPGALRRAMLAAAAERGATYHMLVERYGRPSAERLVGSAELRGASSELILVGRSACDQPRQSVSLDSIVESSSRSRLTPRVGALPNSRRARNAFGAISAPRSSSPNPIANARRSPLIGASVLRPPRNDQHGQMFMWCCGDQDYWQGNVAVRVPLR